MKKYPSLDALAESLVRLTAAAAEPRAVRAARLLRARERMRASTKRKREAGRLAPRSVLLALKPMNPDGVAWYAKRGAVMRGEAPGRADRAVMALEPGVYYPPAAILALVGGGFSGLYRDLYGAGLIRRWTFRDRVGDEPIKPRTKRRKRAIWKTVRRVEYRLSDRGLERRAELLAKWKRTP